MINLWTLINILKFMWDKIKQNLKTSIQIKDSSQRKLSKFFLRYSRASHKRFFWRISRKLFEIETRNQFTSDIS